MARAKPTRRSRLGTVLRYNALHRGLLGGSRGWLAVGGMMIGLRVAKRALGSVPEVVAVEKLQPGQWVSVEALVRPGRRERRALRRASG